jgi:hypothetical protein
MARGGRQLGAGAKKGGAAAEVAPPTLRARDHTGKALRALVETLDDPTDQAKLN